jgi:ABC-type transport system involved in multi-copper enzyme maturation permease subunit
MIIENGGISYADSSNWLRRVDKEITTLNLAWIHIVDFFIFSLVPIAIGIGSFESKDKRKENNYPGILQHP